MKKRLVIDADIMRASKDPEECNEGDHYRSKICGSTLDEIKKNKLLIVINRKIIKQWKDNNSRYASRWVTAMLSSELYFKQDYSGDLEITIQTIIGMQRSKKKLLLKDAHLLEAAYKTDYLLLSMDGNTMNLVMIHLVDCYSIADIMWINPENDTYDCISWIQNGAEYDSSKCFAMITSS